MSTLLNGLKELDPGAFQTLCYHILKEKHPGVAIEQIQGSGGDQGVDIFAGSLQGEMCIWQCKSFRQLGKSQQQQIRESLNRALANFTPVVWILCLPIDFDIRARKWFEKLKREYKDRVRIGLFVGSDIEHELIYRHRIRELFFPNVVLSPSEIKSLLTRSGEFSLEELRNVSTENVQQYVRRLEEKDARFTYRVVFPQESTFSPIPMEAESVPGLIASITDRHGRVDLFARDVEAIKNDPPRFSMLLHASGAEKIMRNITTGSTEEISPEEIVSADLPFDSLFPRGLGTPKMIVATGAEIKKRRRSFRITFRFENETVVYPLIEFGITKAGTEQFTLSSIDPRLPLNVEIVIGSNRKGTFTCRQENLGKEVHAVQKANRAFDIILRGGTVEVFDVAIERTLFSCVRRQDENLTARIDFQRLMDELVEVSDSFGVQLQIPQNFRDDDLQHLPLLLSIAREGRAVMSQEELAVTFAYCPVGDQKTAADRTFDDGNRVILQYPSLNPAPQLLRVDVDTGPVKIEVNSENVGDLEEIKRALKAAPQGEFIKIKFKPFAKVEFAFLKFCKVEGGR